MLKFCRVAFAGGVVMSLSRFAHRNGFVFCAGAVAFVGLIAAVLLYGSLWLLWSGWLAAVRVAGIVGPDWLVSPGLLGFSSSLLIGVAAVAALRDCWTR